MEERQGVTMDKEEYLEIRRDSSHRVHYLVVDDHCDTTFSNKNKENLVIIKNNILKDKKEFHFAWNNLVDSLTFLLMFRIDCLGDTSTKEGKKRAEQMSISACEEVVSLIRERIEGYLMKNNNLIEDEYKERECRNEP